MLVTVKMYGYVTVAVNATTREDAEEKALEKVEFMDLNKLNNVNAIVDNIQ